MFCVFGITTGEFVVAGILPEVATDLDVTIGAAGLIVTAYAVGMIVGGPVLTALTARLDRKRLMLILLGIAVLGNGASALAPDFTALLAARVITALVTSTFFAQAIVVAVRSAPAEHAGTAVARLAFGMNLAMIVGAPLGTAIGGQWGWRAAFAAVGAACLIGLLLVAAVIDEPAPEERRISALAELRVLRRPPVLSALVITAMGNIGVLMVFGYLAPLMTEVAGHPASRLPVLLLGYGVGATIGNLIGGSLHDRDPLRSGPALLGLLSAVLVGTWFVAVAPAPAAVAVVVIGGLGFAIIPGMQARVIAAAAEAPTLAMAVNASGYQVAAAVAGRLGGMITDSTAGPRPIYLVAAGLTLVGLALTLVGTRPAPAGPEPRVAASGRGVSRWRRRHGGGRDASGRAADHRSASV